MDTNLIAFAEEGPVMRYSIEGIHSNKDIAAEYAVCDQPEIYNDKIACGALARLSRRTRDGRKKIHAR
jgi:hypothetical protein